MEPVVQHLKGVNYPLLVQQVLAEAVVLAELLQQLRRRMVVGDPGKYPLPAVGPVLWWVLDYRSVRATQP